jgi:uncharacterized protein with von Willebrand factor type A (vWA) domain
VSVGEIGSGQRATANLVGFVRHLRHAGLRVSPATTPMLVRAATLVGLHNRRDIKAAFHALVVTDKDHEPAFEEAFETFFRGEVLLGLDQVLDRVGVTHSSSAVPKFGESPTGLDEDGENEAETGEIAEIVGGSRAERLMDIDFGDLTPEEADEVAAILAAMRWEPSRIQSRRWRPASGGSRPDMRRTLKAAASPVGDLMPLRFIARSEKQRPLIVIADISGSMERYTRMLLQFLHGAHHRFGRVETFVFATQLTRISRELERRNPTDALAMAAAAVPDWSGGTRIGDAIETYNQWWSRRVSNGSPIGLIISDGWDTGDPAHLRREMDRLTRSVSTLIWLNPLAGREGYEPMARGMAAALPYVDALLAASTVRNLTEVVGLLESVRGQHAIPNQGASIR